jgi:hypothetical protein
MGKKKKGSVLAGWNYSLSDIEGRLRAYGAADNGMKLCPVINEFAEVSEYESYVNMLITETRKDMSISMEDLGQLKMAYKLDSDGPLLEMPFVHFVFNMIMWRPYIVTGIAVTEDDIFAPKHFTNAEYKKFFDRFADNHKDQFTAAGLSEIYHDTQVFMNKLATAMGPLFGNSISIFDMLKMARRNKEVNDILNTHIEDDPDKFRVDEAEQFLRGQTDRLFDILLNEMDDNNPLKPMIRAGVINKHQAQEVFVNVGFKPTLSGDTIPNVTNSSLMGDGLNTPQSAYVDAVGKNCPLWVETLS